MAACLQWLSSQPNNSVLAVLLASSEEEWETIEARFLIESKCFRSRFTVPRFEACAVQVLANHLMDLELFLFIRYTKERGNFFLRISHCQNLKGGAQFPHALLSEDKIQ